ncbi:winged helix-turn-helix domain-containing protein [Marinicella sp. W31]|uniref:winged helix-turn-helix domain-containing protein n=1 Tax=Marinicella sp. W31 TaxID=3023713 RepID=UPI003756387E
MAKSEKIYQLGAWIFETHTGVLKSKHTHQRLPLLKANLLKLLIEHQGKLVSREQIIEVLWKDKIVNEEALSRTVAELRKALQDSATQPVYIKTIPKKGYQFIGTAIDLVQQKKKRLGSYMKYALLFVMLLTGSLLFKYQYWDKYQIRQLVTALNSATRIIAYQGMEGQPHISPDGTKLAYRISNGQGYLLRVEDVLQQSVMIEEIYPDAIVSSPQFSASGKKLLFAVSGGDGCSVFINDLMGQQTRRVTSCLLNNESGILSWGSNDASIIVSDVAATGQSVLWQLELSTGVRQQLTFPEAISDFDISPAISPNGQYLSFSRGTQTQRNLYIQALDGGEALELTQDRHYSVSHTWLDDQYIIYDSDRSGERQLWLLDVNARQSHVLGAYGAQFPSFDRERQYLVFQQAHYEANIWMFDATTGESQLLINSTRYDNNPSFNEVGSKFAFSSNRNSIGVIWEYDFTTGQERQLFAMENSKITRPTWSADGSKVLVSVNNAEGFWSYEFDVESALARRLEMPVENSLAVYAGENIYALTHGDSSIIRMDTQGQISYFNVRGVSRFLPLTETLLVIMKNHQDGMYLFDVQTGQESMLVADVRNQWFNFWTVSGDFVYFTQYTDDPGIWRINYLTSEREKVTEMMPFSVGPAISVSSDHSKILITRTDRAESDVFRAKL